MKTIQMAVALVGVALSSCAAMWVVQSSDPLVKLNDAAILYASQNRPLPAESLINEALVICRQRDDAHCLATGNREYGDFLRSAAVANAETFYRKHGFSDSSITFDNRQQKAAEFYQKALEFYQIAETRELASEQFDALTNTYFNIGNSHRALNEDALACGDYDRSLAAYEENMKRNPGARPHGTRIGGVPETLAAAKKAAGCG